MVQMVQKVSLEKKVLLVILVLLDLKVQKVSLELLVLKVM